MRKIIQILFLMLCIHAYSQEEAENKTRFKEKISWSVDVLSFVRTTDFEDTTGSVNPENRVADLDKEGLGLYFRPDLKYKDTRLFIGLKPRYNVELNRDKNIEDEFYFQEAKIKWQFQNNFYAVAGRYIKSIGTSTFINPSNPYFIESGRVNPKIELRPMDFVEFNYTTKKNLDITLISNIARGESNFYDPLFFDFKRSYGALVEHYGTSANLGSILNISEDKRYHLGFFGQKNMNDAIVLWVDGALNYNPNRHYPVNDHSLNLLNYEMVNSFENEKLFFSGLLGASYTFSFGPTLYLEYLYNGKGYSNEEFKTYTNLIEDATNYNFDITRNLSDLNLGRAINTGMPYIRRHYIFSQIGENDVWGKLNYNLRYFYGFDDNSSQLSSLIEYNFRDNFEIFTVFLSNFGKQGSDFNRLINNQLMIGVIWKI